MLLMSLVAFITELLPLPIRLDIQETKNSGLEIIHSFIHSFILETYIAPLQESTTQRRSQPSHGQRRRTSSNIFHTSKTLEIIFFKFSKARIFCGCSSAL